VLLDAFQLAEVGLQAAHKAAFRDAVTQQSEGRLAAGLVRPHCQRTHQVEVVRGLLGGEPCQLRVQVDLQQLLQVARPHCPPQPSFALCQQLARFCSPLQQLVAAVQELETLGSFVLEAGGTFSRPILEDGLSAGHLSCAILDLTLVEQQQAEFELHGRVQYPFSLGVGFEDGQRLPDVGSALLPPAALDVAECEAEVALGCLLVAAAAHSQDVDE
jgi:hypothetical protein